jgi:hypothetical protein
VRRIGLGVFLSGGVALASRTRASRSFAQCLARALHDVDVVPGNADPVVDGVEPALEPAQLVDEAVALALAEAAQAAPARPLGEKSGRTCAAFSQNEGGFFRGRAAGLVAPASLPLEADVCVAPLSGLSFDQSTWYHSPPRFSYVVALDDRATGEPHFHGDDGARRFDAAFRVPVRAAASSRAGCPPAASSSRGGARGCRRPRRRSASWSGLRSPAPRCSCRVPTARRAGTSPGPWPGAECPSACPASPGSRGRAG